MRRNRLQEVLRQKADAFFSLEGAVLAGDDPEAIHDMRVASRRLQGVLRLIFSDDPHIEELIRVVRRARRVQSPVRDLDVMAEHLRKTAKEAADADAREALRFLQKEVATRRRRRHRKMAEALGALDLSGLRADLEGLMDRWGANRTGIPRVARAQVVAKAQSQIADRTDAFREAAAVARGSLKPDDLHNARIAGKRLRYLLEISDEVQVGSFKRRIAQMRAIQQALGHWHDLEVLEEMVTELFADRETFRRRLPLVRAGCDLIAEWRSQKEAHVREFLQLTEELCPPSADRPVGAPP